MKVNSKSGDRVRIVCTENNITQEKLGDLIYRSKASINRIIKGHTALTRENADSIVKLFPQYRVEWLLGLDDIKNIADYHDLIYSKAKSNHESLISSFRRLAKERGYEVILYYYESGFGEDNIETYVIRNGENQITGMTINDLIDEICDFIDFKLGRILKRGGDNNGKH